VPNIANVIVTHWRFEMADPALELLDETPALDADDILVEDVLVEDVLVEEVSIDGMCGVY
jgi:mycofactocin precursor